MGGVGSQAKPTAYLQYQPTSDSSLSGAANTQLALSFGTDRSSFPNGLFDKPTATQFRALQDCTVRVSYGVGMDANANNEGYAINARISGATDISWSYAGENARTAAAEGNHVANTFLVDLNANQYLELILTKTEGNTLTVLAAQTMMLVELVKLR